MKTFYDNFETVIEHKDQFFEFMRERKDNSNWIDGKISILPITETPLEIGGKTNINGIDAEVYADTAEKSGLLIKIENKENQIQLLPVRLCAISTILQRAGISGNVLYKMPNDLLADIVNKCLKYNKNNAKIKFQDKKISSTMSHEYSIIDMNELADETQQFADKHNFSFEKAYWNHEFLVVVYKGKNEVEFADGKGKVNFSVWTSDIGESAAKIIPRIAYNNIVIPLHPISLIHKGKNNSETFKQALSEFENSVDKNFEKVKVLANIKLNYPLSVLTQLLNKIGIPKKMQNEAVENFDFIMSTLQQVTAYDVFLQLCETVSSMDISIDKRVAYEDALSRLVSIKWENYDNIK